MYKCICEDLTILPYMEDTDLDQLYIAAHPLFCYNIDGSHTTIINFLVAGKQANRLEEESVHKTSASEGSYDEELSLHDHECIVLGYH